MHSRLRLPALALCAAALLAACSDEEGDGAPAAPEPAAIPGTTVRFSLDNELGRAASFYDFPFPSDLRTDEAGRIALRGFPRPEGVAIVENLLSVVTERRDVPVVPAAFFRFSKALGPRTTDEVLPAAPDAPVVLVDVDPDSPARGTLYPTVARTLPEDDYVPLGLLAVAPRPGIVLHPRTTYAFAVLRALGDRDGEKLGSPLALEQLKVGRAPDGASGDRLLQTYGPAFAALEAAGVDVAEIAAATVLTTGDVVDDLHRMSDALRERYDAVLGGLAVDPDDGDHATFCELSGTLTVPQFQAGEPPFDDGGLFVPGADGIPEKQGDTTIPIRISIPKGEMPAAGWPLVLYFHGSGGRSHHVVDRGTWRPVDTAEGCPDGTTNEWEGVQGCNVKGEGPAFVLAPHGFAAASSAMPVNPERLPGASDIAYINFDNLKAGRDLFRQGVIEQRLYLDALLDHAFTADELAGCTGLSLPAGATAHRFDADAVFAQGQSMGGQYTNLVSAVEPRIRASVPTGAGGYWSYFIVQTPLVPDIESLLPLLLQSGPELSYLHPALQLFQMAWEPVDPMVYAARVGRRPLPGHPARSIYEPVGEGDSYFPTPIFDAMALAYGHQQAGEEIWPTMQPALALQGFDGLIDLPASHNAISEDGRPYTGVVIQFRGDGVYDPHAIYTQLDEVKHQYGCFLETARDATATVVPPDARGTPCR